MDKLEVLAQQLDKLCVDSQARMGYDLFADGLCWSDEIPRWEFELEKPGDYPPGHGLFRGLLHYRSSLIVEEPRVEYRDLWEKAMRLCPHWPGFLPSRRDVALAGEYRSRREAGLRSWEELDAQYERQQKAKADNTNI